MEKSIEYLATLAAFLLPFYLAACIYNIVKTRKVNYVKIGTIAICAVIIALSYVYLQPIQRYYEIGMIISMILVFAVALGLIKVVKRTIDR